MKKTGNLLVLILLLASSAFASQGIKGRASLEGTLVDTVEIRIYELRQGGFGPLTGDAPTATVNSGTDGQYSVELKPGRYIVEAIKGKAGGTGKRPAPGDLYCLYSGSPVTVTEGKWTTTGLYMTTVPQEKRTRGAATKIAGTITFKGEPLEKTYLYAFNSPDSLFRGPADVLQPVAKGSFSLEMPPGVWYLLARKRIKGGAYGPIEMGDKLNFYHGNPVRIAEGETVTIEIPMGERIASLEEEAQGRGILVRVVNKKTAKPMEDYHVLIYQKEDRVGQPEYVSERTNAKGEVTIFKHTEGKYIRARKNLGGPLDEKECFADGVLEAANLQEGKPVELACE